MERNESNSAEIAKWIEKPILCLDKGFVRLVDVMGSDSAIVQAARVSYGKGTKKISEDKGLIRYLMRHKHTSPFEMVEFKFHVKVPMDCWRQWIRHRTANVNEYSTRYSLAIDEKQETSSEYWRFQARDNKQGSSGFLSAELGNNFSEKEKEFHEIASNLYKERINAGIAKEQARKDLPLSTYTEAYWKIDLHNLLHFLKLRLDRHAQYEIRVYAEAIAQIVKDVCPLSYEAFEDYSLNAVTFSAPELQWIKNKLEAVPLFVSEKEEMKNTVFGGNGRETEEFMEKLAKLNILSTP